MSFSVSSAPFALKRKKKSVRDIEPTGGGVQLYYTDNKEAGNEMEGVYVVRARDRGGGCIKWPSSGVECREQRARRGIINFQRCGE